VGKATFWSDFPAKLNHQKYSFGEGGKEKRRVIGIAMGYGEAVQFVFACDQ
jgi:hypothetical protein